MPKLILIAVLSILLAGCAGMGYALDNYSGVPVYHVQAAGDTWRVFDKPDESRMMVTSSVGAAMAQGLGRGLLLNAVDNTPPEPQFRQAARQYLDATNREECEIADAYLIITPQFEVIYECPEGADTDVTPYSEPHSTDPVADTSSQDTYDAYE